MTEGQRIEFLYHYFDGYKHKSTRMTGTIEQVVYDEFVLIRADTGAGYDIWLDDRGIWHHNGSGKSLALQGHIPMVNGQFYSIKGKQP
jgi:hypothetical protein